MFDVERTPKADCSQDCMGQSINQRMDLGTRIWHSPQVLQGGGGGG